MGLDNIEGVKEGCESDVQSEILAGGDWSCRSPTLTPGKLLDDDVFSKRTIKVFATDTNASRL